MCRIVIGFLLCSIVVVPSKGQSATFGFGYMIDDTLLVPVGRYNGKWWFNALSEMDEWERFEKKIVWYCDDKDRDPTALSVIDDLYVEDIGDYGVYGLLVDGGKISQRKRLKPCRLVFSEPKEVFSVVKIEEGSLVYREIMERMLPTFEKKHTTIMDQLSDRFEGVAQADTMKLEISISGNAEPVNGRNYYWFSIEKTVMGRISQYRGRLVFAEGEYSLQSSDFTGGRSDNKLTMGISQIGMFEHAGELISIERVYGWDDGGVSYEVLTENGKPRKF